MSPRNVALLAVLAIPAVAFGNGWETVPQGVWFEIEADWAELIEGNNQSHLEIVTLNEAPPRAEWCGVEGLEYTPSTAQCNDYDADLESWMMDFTGVNAPANLPSYDEPATYCGGC